MQHPLTVIDLDYSDGLINQYESLRSWPGFVLLESTDQRLGRYDVVTALPYHLCRVFRGDPFLKDALHRLEALLPKQKACTDLPFQGGAIGYVAYDFADALVGLTRPVHSSNDMPLIHVGLYDWGIVTCHQTKRVVLVAAHHRPETQAIVDEVHARWCRAKKREVLCAEVSPFTPLISKQAYRRAFDDIHQTLVSGRAYQVCYTQPFLAAFRGEPWAVYRRIRTTNPVPYAAYMSCLQGCVICFSPERFLSIDDGWVKTSPIKGTLKRSPDPIIDARLRASLGQSEKNRAENVMIVDLLRNDLSRFANPGSVTVTGLCEVESYQGVHHLVSHVQAQTAASPLEAFMACFPGGSITGAPKREAMRIIHEHERYARGIYCGSLFCLSNHGRFESNIAIRTITAQDDALFLSSGGGIVIDSTWEDEYLECFAKIDAFHMPT